MYLSKALPSLDAPTLHLVKTAFTALDVGEDGIALVNAVDKQLEILGTEQDENENRMVVDDESPAIPTWRDRAHAALLNFPISEQDRNTVDRSTTDEQFVSHILACLPSVLNA